MERFENELYMTTSQVAELLDVHPSTVKRWCNDGDLPVDKTDGGHRRIRFSNVLSLGRQRGIHTILDHFTPYEAHVWTAFNEAAELGSFAKAHALALGWLDRGRIERTAWLFRELGRHPSVPFERFVDDCVRGFMVQIGDLWRRGQLRAGEEHMATEMLIETLLRLRDDAPNGTLRDGEWDIDGREDSGERPDDLGPQRLAVVGAMEGDRHHLAALCLRIMLERRGWRVFYLGGDVPIEDFAAIQKQHRASLVCVSFTPPNTGADMQRCVRVLSEFYDARYPWSLVLGGAVEPLPAPEEIDTPFEEFEILPSLEAFSEVLAEGLGRPTAAAVG